MSLFEKVFGSGEKGSKMCSPQESIRRLREIEEMLQKKSEFLEKKIEKEIAFAKKNGSKNKKGMQSSDLIVTYYLSIVPKRIYTHPFSFLHTKTCIVQLVLF